MEAEQLSSDIVYDYIVAYINRHGYPPSLRNIARGCHLSVSAVVYNLDKLEAWGWLTREPSIPRSIHILREKESKTTPKI